jgi:sensor histidine kinase YesM
VWFLFFELTYFLPYYWYHGWHTTNVPAPVKESGYLMFSFIVFVNTILALTIQIIFTYTLLYFLLPRYLLKGKAMLFIVLNGTLLFACVVLFYFEFKYCNPVIRHLFNQPSKIYTHKELLSCCTDMVFFNCPTVGGIALGIELLKRWWLKQNESMQLTTAVASAELQLLKAQIHPHFLFNTLNNLYWFIINASPKAPEMVKQLSGMLHYIIYECNQPLVPLEKELAMIKDYTTLEKVRYGDQIDMSVDIRGDAKNKLIAPLLLIPFVENCFKHGASKMLSKPLVNLNIILEEETLYFQLNNSKPLAYSNTNHKSGIGLSNVEKRLQILYPGSHHLIMTEEPEHFTVMLELEIHTATDSIKIKNRNMQKHAVA